jgi:ParB family transcriptional regulator, chromosome partitioning protein
MSRKDSKGMFAAVLGQLDNDEVAIQQPTTTPRSSSPHLLKVAAGVRQMQERSDLADKLLKDGDQIVELDPDTVLPSTIHDRYEGAYDAAAISEIVESIRERGQIVPGLVRPSPVTPGAFQIVYGRRRLAAAKRLGIKFKAAVRELSDEQAVVFQGEENTARQDLSFIEKCSFAVAQQEAGYKRETICASLSTGKSHVSEMIKIGTSIHKEILHAIGAAPGIGRGRWEDLARRYVIEGNAAKAYGFVRKGRFLEASSDDRFNLLFAVLTEEPAEPSTSKIKGSKLATKSWAPPDKSVSVSLKDNGKTATLALGAANGSLFASFIAGQLDELYGAFMRSKTKQTGD